MTLFRLISLTVLMAALLLLYRIHPIAGWSTLTALFVGALAARRRKLRVAVRE